MVKAIEGYILNEVIGEGNFGQVFRATHKERPGIYAVKVIPIQKFQENQKLEIYTNSEIEALQTIGISDYIIRFYQMIKSKNNCYLVYEYCNGGTLLSLLRKEQKLEEKQALLIFKQLLEAFKVLNKNNIMHRDLKPQNIFFTSVNHEQTSDSIGKKKVKLGDFGFCKGLKPDENLAKTMLGSPIYMAPEVLKGESYSTKADIWSLGVILFEMLYGYCPFESRSIANLISTIDTQQVQLPSTIPVSEKTQNLIKRMLTKDYFRRIGWVQLFNIKINESGEYCDEYAPSSEEKGLTPNKKIFSSLLGSLTLQSSNNLPNNRSYSMVREEEDRSRHMNKLDPKYGARKVTEEITTAKQNGTNNVVQIRVSSQPKDQKKFYSQNYMNVLSTPLSLKKIEAEQAADKSREKARNTENERSIKKQKQQGLNNLGNSAPISMPSSPQLIFREERLTSMDNIDIAKQANSEFMAMGSNPNIPIEPIPFNKYRQNIGMASNLYNKFLSDRNIKQSAKQSTVSSSSPNQIDLKRNNLLKIHQYLGRVLSKTLLIVEQSFSCYKKSREVTAMNSVKELLQDCYLVLKIAQERLKHIAESIKITETSLLDMASIVNYEHIQVEKFLIETRNELVRCSAELPTAQATQSGRQERPQNVAALKDMIKNRAIVQLVDELV